MGKDHTAESSSDSSSWNLLPGWSLSSKKSKDKLKRLSAFRKRIHAHAVIARTLSPFCTRTRLESLVFEEGKCLLAFSALLHSCSCAASTAIKDVQVPTNLQSANDESSTAQAMYISDVHHKHRSADNLDRINSGRHPNATKRSAPRQDEKLKVVNQINRSDKASGGLWMKDTVPVVKYSYDPCMDFHDSMLEMLLGRGLRDVQELQEMFVSYVLLNSPRHHKHIENAFRNLLTDLYNWKLVVPSC